MTPLPESHGSDSYAYCGRCYRWYGTDPALVAMAKAVPGSNGYYSAMGSWTGEPCECPDGPQPDEDPDAAL